MNRTLNRPPQTNQNDCCVCGPNPLPKPGEPYTLCEQCANPQTINLYCVHCGLRVEFTFEEGREFIRRFRLADPPNRPGLVIRFNPCAFCATNSQEIIDGYRIFRIIRELDSAQSDSPPGHLQ